MNEIEELQSQISWMEEDLRDLKDRLSLLKNEIND
tara:strand:+ start:1308 stop:1412 length:105 start_codon:yes stop_codon:yes gene_type:complete